MQSQIHLKKAGQTAKSRELAAKNRNAVLAPVMELNKKPKKDDKVEDINFKASPCCFYLLVFILSCPRTVLAENIIAPPPQWKNIFSH
jgi:hypothetical protein